MWIKTDQYCSCDKLALGGGIEVLTRIHQNSLLICTVAYDTVDTMNPKQSRHSVHLSLQSRSNLNAYVRAREMKRKQNCFVLVLF
jgi:hypothetical protein